jgi:hypothetical protein
MGLELQTNQREFFRIELKNTLGADMAIFKIGPTGLKFLSDLKLPANPDITLKFETEILDKTA